MANRLMMNKPSNQLVIDLINFQNQTSLKLNELVFGVPTTPQSSVEAQGRNTKLRLDGTANATFQGTAYVYYNRLALDLLFQRGVVGVLDNFTTLAEALMLVNRDYNLGITIDELETFNRSPDGSIRFKIYQSLVYQPGTEIIIEPLSTLTGFEGWVDRLWYFTNYTLRTRTQL